MKLATLELFEEVYRRGSFSAVARARDLAPSAVSRAVAALEEELGTLLFYRTTRRVAPTEAAAVLFKEVGQHLDALRSLRTTLSDASGSPSGTLRISASHSFGIRHLSRIVPRFCAAYPNIRVELSLADRVVDIVGERFDLALRHGPLPDSSLIAQSIVPSRYHACASPAYLALAGRPSEPAEIAQRACLTFPLPGFSNIWRFRDGEGRDVDVPIRSSMSANSGLFLRNCALRGQGIVLLSDWLIGADLADGSLVDLFPSHRATPNDFQSAVSAVYPDRRYTPRKVTLFISCLRDYFGAAGGLGASDPD